MATFKPVVLLGDAAGMPVHDRANGLVVRSGGADALLELATDPVLAHQFALAARRTYEITGLRDLAIVDETAGLLPHPGKGDLHAGGQRGHSNP